MAEPFLAEIRIFSFNFAPQGWAFCNGQLMPVNQNQALFSLLGTTYGGDGKTTFALPDLRGRLPVHQGNGVTLGLSGGEEGHVLTIAEMPSHTHAVQGSQDSATGNTPASTAIWGAASATDLYSSEAPNVSMSLDATSKAGKSQAHQNMQPYLTLNVCIALQGIFPSRN